MVRRPGFVRRRKTSGAPRRSRARSTADYSAVVNRSALGGTGLHTHTHKQTNVYIYNEYTVHMCVHVHANIFHRTVFCWQVI